MFQAFSGWLPEYFLRNFDASGDIFTRLNVMTTGRLESYVGGVEHFMESPFFGKGPFEATIAVNSGQVVSVHNLWLRQLAESGIVVLVPLLFLTFHIVSLVRASRFHNDANQYEPKMPHVYLVILCGLIISSIEPGVMIGAFNSGVVMWAAIWIALAGTPVRRMR